MGKHGRKFIGKGELRGTNKAREQAYKDIQESGEPVLVREESKIREWIKKFKPFIIFTNKL